MTATTTMISTTSRALSSPPLPLSSNISPSSSPRSTRSTQRSVGSPVSPTSPTFPAFASSMMTSSPARSPSVQSTAPPTPRTSPPRTSSKAARVPVLLEAFPAPPSHIPTPPLNLTPSTLNCPPLTPTSSTSSAILGSPIVNPPPSRPPSLPLPPVPGPSRISEHDTVLLLSSVGKRSKRNSRYSTMASDGRRDSVMSGESGGGRDSYYSSSKGRDSTAIEEVDEFGSLKVKTTKIARQGGSKSSQSPTQLSASPYLSPVSPKSNAATSMEQLTRVTMSPMPLSDTEDEGHVLPAFANVVVHPSTPRKGSFQASMGSRSLGPGSGRSPTLSSSHAPRARAHHAANESISSIDMRDLPADDDTEWGVIKPGSKPIPDDDLEYILESHGKNFSTIPSVNVVQASPFRRAPISVRSRQNDNTSQHTREFSLADPIDPMASISSEVPDVMNYSRPLVNKTRSPPVSPSDSLPPFSPFSSAPKHKTPTAPISSSTPLVTSGAPTTSPTPMSPISPSFNSASSSYPSPAPSALSSPAPSAAPILAPRTATATTEEPRTSSPDIDDILAQQPRISKKPSSIFVRKGRTVSEARERVLSSSSQLSASSARNRVSSASSHLSGSTSNSTPGNPRLSSTSTSTSTRFSSGSGNLRLSSASYGSPRISSASSPRPGYSFHLSSSPPVGPGFGFSPNPGHVATDSESWSRRDVSYAYDGFDDTEDYGEPDDANGEYDLKLERALEGEGSDGERFGDGDSDSSIDIHTPLPHLMLRHGLLSPNSKLLPGADSRASTPHGAGVDGRPGSTLSLASVAGSLLKDERDTPMRRVRHRDGKLLRGGIGLTTGLGWSDSEDEDAPSPLTRRLSALNLSRRSSASSVLPSAPRTPKHPLSRSFSSGTVLEGPIDGEELQAALREHGEWAQRQRNTSSRTARTTLPPTAWQKRNTPTTSRMSSSSIGSNVSSDSNTPATTKQEHLDLRTPTKPRVSEPGKGALNTLSTPSSRGIPLPSKSKDRSNSIPAAKLVPVDKEKSLPPLPDPSLVNTTSPATSRIAFPRARTYSSTSSASSPIITSGTIPDAPPVPLTPSVRPLHLPRQLPRSGSGDRPAVPVPSVNSVRSPSLGTSRPIPLSSPELVTSPNISSSPSTPSTPKLVGIMKPKSRTGTGMVYRNTSASGSKMRAPVPLTTSVSASVFPNAPPPVPSGRMTPSAGRKTPSEKKMAGSVSRIMSAGAPKAIAL